VARIVFAASTIVASLLITANADAQPPRFEVAAIRLNKDTGPIQIIDLSLRKGRLTGSRVTLRRMLAVAYGMTEPRVVGPDWLNRNRFDIMAKSPEGVPDNEMEPMLQALLKNRFKLTAHLETREMAIYGLVVAKGGVKMPVYPATDRGPDVPWVDPNVRGFPMIRGAVPLSQFAGMLSSIVNRPVIDKTGLTERYSFFLPYAPLTPQTGNDVPEFGPPDLFTALQSSSPFFSNASYAPAPP
jgi:uncharacterized protein (TIGR03435 family)